MYFNNNNNFFHGIMFHHFHDNGVHARGPGSISKDDLYKMINFIGKKHILDADIFYEKMINKKLKENEYKQCLSLISEILDKSKNEIKYMAHPCGSYNNDTLAVLKALGIELGFKKIMTDEPGRVMKKINNSFLEVAREDHTTIFKIMN